MADNSDQQNQKNQNELKATGQRSDEDVKLVVTKDVNEAEGYMGQWFYSKWGYLNDRFMGILQVDEDLPAWQSRMTMNLGFGIVTKEGPRNLEGLYQPNQFFVMTPRRKNDDEAKEGCKYIEKTIYCQIPNVKLFSRLHGGVNDSLVFGVGWEKFTWLKGEKVKPDVRAEDGKVKTKKKRKRITQPLIECCSPYDVLYDWEATSIDDVRWMAHKYYLKIKDIQDNPKIYNRANEVKDLLGWIDLQHESKRPSRILVYEYWTVDEVVTMTEKGHMIRRTPNLYGRIPFRPLIKYPLPREIIGIGTVEAVSDNIDYIDALMNIAADSTRITTIPTFKTNKQFDENEEIFWPGKLFRFKAGEILEKLEFGSTGVEWINMTKVMDGYMNQVIGNLDQIDTKSAKTATESRISAQLANAQYQSYINYNRENFLKWMLEVWVENIADNMTADEVAETIGADEEDIPKITKFLEKLKNRDIDYVIELTGDTGLEDRMIAIENVEKATQTIANIMALAETNAPIDVNMLVKHAVSKFDFPDGVYVDPEEAGMKGESMTVEQQIETAAQAKGMTGQQLIQEMAQQAQTTPDKILADVQKVGSFTEWLKAMAQRESKEAKV